MIKYENQCCDCVVPGYPCKGDSCSRMNVPVYYCDFCKSDVYAKYEIDDEHCCEEHAKKYLREIFDELTLSEQAEILEISLKRLED